MTTMDVQEKAQQLYRGELLAPMVRASTTPLRTLALQYGANAVYSEELVDRSIVETHRGWNEELQTIDYVKDIKVFPEKTRRKLLANGSALPVLLRIDPAVERNKLICQLGTGEPGLALQAALHIHGAKRSNSFNSNQDNNPHHHQNDDVASFDINMGCPKKFSTAGGMGSALLKDVDRACDIISTLRQNIPDKPVSAKIRFLSDSSSEVNSTTTTTSPRNRRNNGNLTAARPDIQQTLDFIQALIERGGANAVAIHARTVGHESTLPADWNALREVVIHCKTKYPHIPILVNGDFYTRQEFTDFMQDTKADGVLLGRPALYNTSIFRKPTITNDYCPAAGTAGTEGNALYGYNSPLLFNKTRVIQEYLRDAVRYDVHYKNTKYVLCELMSSGRSPTPRLSYLPHIYPGQQTIAQVAKAQSLQDLCDVWNVDYDASRRANSGEAAPAGEHRYEDEYLLKTLGNGGEEDKDNKNGNEREDNNELTPQGVPHNNNTFQKEQPGEADTTKPPSLDKDTTNSTWSMLGATTKYGVAAATMLASYPLIGMMRGRSIQQQSRPMLIRSALLAAGVATTSAVVSLQRYLTRRRLEKCGLPTVYWSPRFITYRSGYSHGLGASAEGGVDKKLPSSNITNIFPRMKRLNGPYGIYGTVYGISTKVVHIGHPVPATAIMAPARSRVSLRGSKSSEETRTSFRAACAAASLKAPAYDHFKDFCGEGVFTADGSDWQAKRSAVMHALFRIHGEQGGFESKLERIAEMAAERLVATIRSKEEGTKTSHLNVVPVLQRATVGLIFRYITDVDLDDALSSKATAGKENTDADKNNQKPESLLSSYRDSITRIRMIILAQSRSIWFLLPRFFYRLFSSMYREEQEVMGPIRKFSELACLHAKEGSSLATLRDTPTYQKANDKDPSPSKNLLDEAITLLFAGQDTSAATLSWTLHLLSLYPHVQEKAFREVSQTLSSVAPNEPLSKKVISNMTYLDAVIKEAMRLYPVAPFVVRRLTNDIVIDDLTGKEPTATLPQGSFACIWIYALHRNSEYWKNPNDFLPERWLSSSDDKQQRDRGIGEGAYMPFALGPRNCLGQPFAQIVLRTLLARLVQNFYFQDARLTDNVDPMSLRKDMQAGFTVLPQNGAFMNITTRV